MADNLIYEGPIRVYTADKSGTPYTIKSGQNAGKPYSRISFTTADGQTIYLADFSNHSREVGDNGTAKVAYAVKVDGFGDPELYNGNQQYVLEALKPTGDAPQQPSQQTQTGQTGAPVAQATPTHNAGGMTPQQLFSLHQTALNGAISLTSNGIVQLENLYEVANDNFAWLMGQPVDPLDRLLKAAKDAGMTEDGGAGDAFPGPTE